MKAQAFGSRRARKAAPLVQRTQKRACTPARSAAPSASWSVLEDAVNEVKNAPPSMKQDASSEVLNAMNQLKEGGLLPKWGATVDGTFSRRGIALPELKQMGIKNPEGVAIPSTRNDLAFLVSVVGVTSVLAVAGTFLPGDWGFFVPYLTGGISIGVLAIGSTAPGLLTFAIDKFSQVFPDYRERVVRHEAAHFVVGYAVGVPVVSYDLGLGREHTDFAEASLQKRLFQSSLENVQVDRLAVVSMAGVAAEAMHFEEVMGQTADLMDLQRILNRSAQKLSNAQQQSITRWAVWEACRILRTQGKEYEAVMKVMGSGGSVAECIKAIEQASTP